MMYDAVIIGAGVIGSAIAREIARFRVRACVLERAEDVCCGTSKANSAIVHAGFDAMPGTWMAKMNVEGNARMEPLSRELDFPFRRNGSLVLCTTPDGVPTEEGLAALRELAERGRRNGVEGLEILNRKQLLAMEPNLSSQAAAALFAPTGGIVCPFGLTIALAENAAVNGVEFRLETEVRSIEKTEGGYRILTNRGTVETKAVINAAGVYADRFHNMVSEDKIRITARKGEYCLFDHTVADTVSRTIFQLPTEMGKGVLVTPTVHGNLLIGPTAVDIEDKEGTHTTRGGLDSLLEKAALSIQTIPMRQVITSFAGLRAHGDRGDFILGEAAGAPGFFDAAGIESPGLTSAPAIGAHMAALVAEKLSLEPNPEFCGTRKGIPQVHTLPLAERAALIRERPEYGNIICRCEMISEGEILDAIHRPLGARSLDGVKRRTRAGMGRCQAGFCSPRTMEILRREVPLPMTEVTKCGGNSKILVPGGKREMQEIQAAEAGKESAAG